jgi:lipopolysaccharide/colanic/teichoic acid biosynthesis glycosyltransferase
VRLGYLVKRGIDYAAATAGLVAAGPAMLAIAAAIRMDSPGGALFVQERLGRDGKPFRLLKFRTMHAAPIQYNADGSTRVEATDARVTRVGRYLRGALDELPQLVNILRGEMSLIGPRPDMVHQRELYGGDEHRKLEVLPGITGLPVVLGRNDIPWKQRIAIDVKYIDRWSLALDLKIIAQTLAMPLKLRLFDFAEVLEEPGIIST